MPKYFGMKSRQDFIDEIHAGHLWIYYKNSCYVFTEDGRGYNLIPQTIEGREIDSPEMGELTVSADTVEELIDKAVLYDGVTLNEALETDLKREK